MFRTLDRLGEVVEKVSGAFRGVSPPALANPPSMVEGLYPAISPAKGCCDAILRLIDSSWGRTKPRTLREVLDALRANALYYPASTVGKSLQRLIQRGRLRRWKTKEGYVYVIA